MHIIFSARGEKAEAISYFLGKHPSNPFQRETDFGNVEVKFLAYEEEYVKVYITFLAKGLDMVKQSQYKGLEQYINDREFVVSTIFLTNIRRFIGHVLSRDYDNINTRFDFDVEFGPISTALTDEDITTLFEAMGYAVQVETVSADYHFRVDSGRVVVVRLTQHTDIVTVFRQLFVLIPVLDNYKHYPLSADEAEKLLRYGEGWLETHPQKYFITKRYMRNKGTLVQRVMDQIVSEADKLAATEQTNVRLAELRYRTFANRVDELGVRQVVDMGAGEGRLLQLLVRSTQLQEIIACEPTESGLQDMHYQLERWETNNEVNVRPQIYQSSLFYRDERLLDKDCMVLCEVIEHIDRDRIDNVMASILGYYKPKHVLVSTPNVEYNKVYQMNEMLRHNDHRFELSRAEFAEFIRKHTHAHGYNSTIEGIGDVHPEFGQPTQLAILSKG